MTKKLVRKPARDLIPEDKAKDHEPTEQERQSARRFLERKRRSSPMPVFKVEISDGTTKIEPSHADVDIGYVLLSDMFATGDGIFAVGLLNQIANASRTGKDFTAHEVNTMLAAVHEIGPRDPIEALLATQMVAVHTAAMLAVRRLNHSETIDLHDCNSNAFNKLTRTFAAQVETLKRYRADGEQKVTVQHQHVTVSANQAVVGVSQGGGGAHEKSSQSHAPSQSDERSTTLLRQKQALRLPLPGPGTQRPVGVPNARGTRRSPNGRG